MRTSGQTGCASKSAVAPARIEFQKFRRCPGPSHVQRNPIMYVVWGGKSNIFGARGPGRKKSRSQGVRSPDLLPKVGRGTWLGNTPSLQNLGLVLMILMVMSMIMLRQGRWWAHDGRFVCLVCHCEWCASVMTTRWSMRIIALQELANCAQLCVCVHNKQWTIHNVLDWM